MNSLFVLSWHYEFIVLWGTQLWIDFVFQEFTIYYAYIQWIHYLFREFTINSLSVLGIHYESTIYFAT